MIDLDKAEKIVSENPLRNVAALGMLKRGTVTECNVAGRSVLLYDEKAGIYSLIPQGEAEAKALCSALPDECDLFLADTAYNDSILTEIAFVHYSACTQYVYNGFTPQKPESDAKILPLTPKDTAFVVAHYSNPGVSSDAYIRSRIEDGPAFGAYIGENLAGFILTHSEGSMGALEVLPEYRRLGIAYALEYAMVQALLSRGAVPFAHIKLGNAASEHLQQKLGLVKTEKEIAWTTVRRKML